MDKQIDQEEQAMQKIKETVGDVWIWWRDKTYEERVQEILANYSKEDEDYDLKILVYLKNNHKELYDYLESDSQDIE